MTNATPKTTAPKRTRKVAVPKKDAAPNKGKAVVKAETVKVEKSPQVNPHIAAGVSLNRYKGPSSYVNSNRAVKIMIKDGVAASKLTSRAQGGFYALRDSYKEGAFQAHGFDNGILRDLVASGLVNTSGGQKTVIDGKDYITDGAKPVTLKITAAGMAYGKA